MKPNLKEILRWVIFVPAALILGRFLAFLIDFSTINLADETDLILKIFSSFIFWISTYWSSAYLKPEKLSIKLWQNLTYRKVYLLLNNLLGISIKKQSLKMVNKLNQNKTWRQTPIKKRIQIIKNIATLLKKNQE